MLNFASVEIGIFMSRLDLQSLSFKWAWLLKALSSQGLWVVPTLAGEELINTRDFRDVLCSRCMVAGASLWCERQNTF